MLTAASADEPEGADAQSVLILLNALKPWRGFPSHMPFEDIIGREPVQPQPSAPEDPVWLVGTGNVLSSHV